MAPEVSPRQGRELCAVCGPGRSFWKFPGTKLCHKKVVSEVDLCWEDVLVGQQQSCFDRIITKALAYETNMPEDRLNSTLSGFGRGNSVLILTILTLPSTLLPPCWPLLIPSANNTLTSEI